VALLACTSPAASPGAGIDGGADGDGNGGQSDGSPGPGSGSPGTDLTACELVAPADIEAALDLDPGTVLEGTRLPLAADDPAAHECSYHAQSWGSLTVHLIPASGAETFDAIASSAGSGAERLEIGDAALWIPSAGRGLFLAGTVLIIIQFIRPPEGIQPREPIIELGSAAVERL
jgi:hypothetical protein